jgi:hypothetical protein
MSAQPETPYVAPARFVLTVLHRKGGPPGHPAELATAEPVDGWTVCGRAMLQSESWVAIGFRDGDSVRDEKCSLPGDPLAVAPDEAEATLW